MLGQGLDLPLLLVGIGRTAERRLPKGRFKEREEGARANQVGLIDLPGHGVGQLRRHSALPSEEKTKASREEVVHFDQMTPLSRQNHLCLLAFIK
jgi:hypothetical protein